MSKSQTTKNKCYEENMNFVCPDIQQHKSLGGYINTYVQQLLQLITGVSHSVILVNASRQRQTPIPPQFAKIITHWIFDTNQMPPKGHGRERVLEEDGSEGARETDGKKKKRQHGALSHFIPEASGWVPNHYQSASLSFSTLTCAGINTG